MSKFLYKIILRPDILGIFYQIFFRETPFLKLDLLYNHVINITPWLEPIFFPLETNLTLEMVTDLLWVFE